jgi:hypothetical protein
MMRISISIYNLVGVDIGGIVAALLDGRVVMLVCHLGWLSSGSPTRRELLLGKEEGSQDAG